MNASDAHKAHRILSRLFEGRAVTNEEREFLRRALPERPRQMTLEEIHVMVSGYYSNESDERGYLPVGGNHVRPWMNELREQLYGLVRAQEEAPSYPALPEGMRLADHERHGRVVVSPHVDQDGEYACYYLSGNSWGAYMIFAKPSDLSFIDTESAKPATPPHPEFLETRQDYEDAPVGTIVTGSHHLDVFTKGSVWFEAGSSSTRGSTEMSGTRRRVLRRGWGDA